MNQISNAESNPFISN